MFVKLTSVIQKAKFWSLWYMGRLRKICFEASSKRYSWRGAIPQGSASQRSQTVEFFSIATVYFESYIKPENGCYRYISEWFQPRNRVSPIILSINANILERNPVSQPTE